MVGLRCLDGRSQRWHARSGDEHAVVAVDDRRQVHLARRDPGLGNVRDPQLVRVRGAGSGESGVWHKTVICWLVLVVYLYIQCENYAFAALPLLVFAASKVRRER